VHKERGQAHPWTQTLNTLRFLVKLGEIKLNVAVMMFVVKRNEATD
jgi:hypothetical protein